MSGEGAFQKIILPLLFLVTLILDLKQGGGCSGMWWNLGFLATKFTPNTLPLTLATNRHEPASTGATKRNLQPAEEHGGVRYGVNTSLVEISSFPTSIMSGGGSSLNDMNTIATWCNLPGLSAGQKKLCVLYHDHMYGVGKGAAYGIHECQYQFRAQRWNCSVRRDDESVFGPILKIPSRETAFAHAINSAGVVHAISRFCRQGVLASCGCPQSVSQPTKSRDGRWKWQGCGDNLKYGYRFATEFIDIREREKFRGGGAEKNWRALDRLTARRVANRSADDNAAVGGMNRNRNKFAKSLMNLHNNEAGRRAVHHTSQMNCKCHGVSGSCSVKTCWLQLGSFRKTGHLLKEKYDAATRVKLNRQSKLQVAAIPSTENGINNRDKRTSARQSLKSTVLRVPTALDLVFLKRSPDFCRYDPVVGFSGTSGRVCAVQLDPVGRTTSSDQRYADIRDLGSFGDFAGRRVIRDDGAAENDDTDLESLGATAETTRNLVSVKGGDVNDLMTFYLFSSSSSSSSLSTTDDVTPSKHREADACQELCCGRGFIRRTLVLQLRCDCKFQWCCHVSCSLCERNVTLFVCR